MSDWTPEYQKAWEATWKEEHMLAGLARLKEQCRVPGKILLPDGDLKEIASQSYAHAQGQSDVFDKIEALKPTATHKPLPPQFQKTPPPKPQPEED